MKPLSTVVCLSMSLTLGTASVALSQTPSLEQPAGFRPINVELSAANYRGRAATRVIGKAATPPLAGGEEIAILPGTDFEDGTIELDVAGRVAPGADTTARGFVGLAFDVIDGGSRFKSFYLRPLNGRAPDQLRRNHSTQYPRSPNIPGAASGMRNPGCTNRIWTSMRRPGRACAWWSRGRRRGSM